MLRFRSHELAEQQLISLQSYTVAQTTDKDAYQRYVDVLKAGLYVMDGAAPEQERLDRSALAELRNKIGRR